MVLAKIRRPSATPVASTPRSFSNSTTSAASLATSVALSTEMPTSAACNASASLTPSPRKPTERPMRRREAISRAFCSGEMRAKMVWFCATSANSSSSRGLQLCAGDGALGRQTQIGADLFGDPGLSPVAILSSMPSSASSDRDCRAAGFGFVGENQEPGQQQVAFVAGGDRRSARRAGLAATATTRRPAANKAARVSCATAAVVWHWASTCSGAPLTTSTRFPSSSTSTDVARRSWSNGSVATRRTAPPINCLRLRRIPRARRRADWR